MSEREIEKVRQELAMAIESAIEKLPEGWTIEIQLEKGYSAAVLIDPEGVYINTDEPGHIDTNLADQIQCEIAHAITHDFRPWPVTGEGLTGTKTRKGGM